MKNLFFLLAALAALASSFCFAVPDHAFRDMPAAANDPDTQCSACHTIDTKQLGPSWQSIADRYRGSNTFVFEGKTYPLQEGLLQKMIQGGSGNWGAFPEPERKPGVASAINFKTKEKINNLLDYILKLKVPSSP